MSLKSILLNFASSIFKTFSGNIRTSSEITKDLPQQSRQTVDTASKFKMSEDFKIDNAFYQKNKELYGERHFVEHTENLQDIPALDYTKLRDQKLRETIEDELINNMAKKLLKQNGKLSDHEIEIFETIEDSQIIAELLGLESIREQCLDEME